MKDYLIGSDHMCGYDIQSHQINGQPIKRGIRSDNKCIDQ